MGGVSFPLLSDFWPHGGLAQQFGVLRSDGTTERAIFVVDPDGVITYADVHDIDDQPDNEILFAELEALLPSDAAPLVQNTRLEEQKLPKGGVVMYCTPWCIDCSKAKDWLRACGIPFREVNISLNRTAAQQVREWANGNLVTPTFDIDGTIVVDFDQKRLAEVLGMV
jgi:glutaredoxin